MQWMHLLNYKLFIYKSAVYAWRYIGEIHNSKPHGTGIATYVDGTQYSGSFFLGLPEGPGKILGQDGQELKSGVFQQGKLSSGAVVVEITAVNKDDVPLQQKMVTLCLVDSLTSYVSQIWRAMEWSYKQHARIVFGGKEIDVVGDMIDDILVQCEMRALFDSSTGGPVKIIVQLLDDDVDDPADELDFDEARPVLNSTIEDLKKGIVRTKEKGRSEYTILLVGETGTGKSSLLAFIANVLAGNSLSKYDFATLDQANERGVSQKESQTKYAKLYEFTSRNGVKVNVLDTPGLADPRGIQQDELHKKWIETAIKEQVTAVHAVLILMNGTLPRLSVRTEYALTTLSSISPKSLVDNISLVFTMCSKPPSINLTDVVPRSLETAPQFYIDNPLSLLHKYRQMTANRQCKQQLRAASGRLVAGEAAALQTMTRFFDWLDALKPQPTTDILTVFDKSQTIQQQISDIVSQMIQAQLAYNDRVVAREMVKLADLAEEYGKISLSGSFSEHLERGVMLLEMRLAPYSEQMKRLEKNVAELKRKLDVLKEANRFKQKAKNLGKGWDNATKQTTGAGPTAAPAAGVRAQIQIGLLGCTLNVMAERSPGRLVSD